MIVSKKYNYSAFLQEAIHTILTLYKHNPYVVVGFEEDCANALAYAYAQCTQGKRVLKYIAIGTQECLETLECETLAYLVQKDVRIEFFMQVQNPFDNHILRQYGTLFCFKNAKSQPQSF